MIIKDYLIKYDLHYQRMEIMVNDQIKVLGAEKIDQFTWFNITSVSFINTANFLFSTDEKVYGFFQVIYPGEAKLLKYIEGELLEANYVPEVDMGRKHDKIVKSESYYFAKGDEVHPFSGKKKEIIKKFPQDVQTYIKKERINFKREDDLKMLIAFYNSTLL